VEDCLPPLKHFPGSKHAVKAKSDIKTHVGVPGLLSDTKTLQLKPRYAVALTPTVRLGGFDVDHSVVAGACSRQWLSANLRTSHLLVDPTSESTACALPLLKCASGRADSAAVLASSFCCMLRNAAVLQTSRHA
jgi:hypothetical protein